jgi:hypothetical protein
LGVGKGWMAVKPQIIYRVYLEVWQTGNFFIGQKELPAIKQMVEFVHRLGLFETPKRKPPAKFRQTPLFTCHAGILGLRRFKQ